MKEVMDFLNTSGVYYLATTDGERAYCRPIGFVMEWEGKLAFCSSNEKDMCKQMAGHPHVQISCVDKDMKTLRLTGKAAFCTTPAAQKKALEVMPALGGLYSVGDGKFEIFVLEGASAVIQTMTGETQALPL